MSNKIRPVLFSFSTQVCFLKNCQSSRPGLQTSWMLLLLDVLVDVSYLVGWQVKKLCCLYNQIQPVQYTVKTKHCSTKTMVLHKHTQLQVTTQNLVHYTVPMYKHGSVGLNWMG